MPIKESFFLSLSSSLLQTVPCFNVTSSASVGKMRSAKDLQDVSFIDHLIPKYSSNKFSRATTHNGIFPQPPMNGRRFFFAKSNGHPMQSQEEEEDEQQRYQNTNQFKRDQFGSSDNNLNSETATNSTITAAAPFIDTTASDEEEIRGKRSLFPFDLPQEFPLTRTVSTSTDLNNNSDSELNYCGIFMKHVNKTNRVSSTTTTTTMTKGILKGTSSNAATTTTTKRKPLLRRSKEDLFNEFCKKTGRLIKPKNIYYIDSRGEDEDDEQTEQQVRETEKELQVLAKERIVVVNPREMHFRNSNSPQQNFHQMRRSKSFQAADDFQEPLYYSQFTDRQHPLLQQQSSSPSPRNMMMYQSQTLPRNFMKGGISSQSQLHIPHISRQFATSNAFVNRSFDNFLGVPSYHPNNPQHHHHPRHQPNWPKCIPSSPSAFSGRLFYQAGGGRGGAGNGMTYNSLSRESVLKAATGNEFGSFDLDRIEKDCRISHASLFQGHNGYTSDYSKSTAV